MKRWLWLAVAVLCTSPVLLHAEIGDISFGISAARGRTKTGGTYYDKNPSGQFQLVSVDSDTTCIPMIQADTIFQVYPRWPWSEAGFGFAYAPFRQDHLGVRGDSYLLTGILGARSGKHRWWGIHSHIKIGYGHTQMSSSFAKVEPNRVFINGGMVTLVIGLDRYFKRSDRGVWDLGIDWEINETATFLKSPYRDKQDKNLTWSVNSKSVRMMVSMRYWHFRKKYSSR